MVEEWIKRMRKISKDSDIALIRKWIKTNCEYGFDNYCDGRAVEKGKRKASCKYFVNGVCMKRKEECDETDC